MREIKYRAIYLDINRTEGEWKYFGIWGNDINDYVEGSLGEFTGLKDKNGKEIYEGDIIICSATQREVNDVIEEGTQVVVKYQDGYFYPFGYNCGWRSDVWVDAIIGNIHQHPELLEKRMNVLSGMNPFLGGSS